MHPLVPFSSDKSCKVAQGGSGGEGLGLLPLLVGAFTLPF